MLFVLIIILYKGSSKWIWFFMKKIFRGGSIVTANGIQTADLLIIEDKIDSIGTDLYDAEAEIIDCIGMIIMPGGVEPHAHFSLPMFDTISSDNHYTGHRAAAFGGSTTVLDFTSQLPGQSLQASIANSIDQASKSAAVDYSFHINVTDFNADIEKEIRTLSLQGFTSLKVFTAYNDTLRILDEEIMSILEVARDHGLVVMIHAEDGDEIENLVSKALSDRHHEPIWHARTRPSHGEVNAGKRVIDMVEESDAILYIVHISTSGLLKQLVSGRRRGVRVMGETCPQYLFFTDENLLQSDGGKYVCSPPLRSLQDNTDLWEGLSDGSLQTVGTDHCPFFANGKLPIEYDGDQVSIPGKELGDDDFTKIPNGLPVIEHRMALLWTFGVSTGKLSVERFVELVSTNPAKIFGLYPRKGALMPGSDADIVVWDPNKKHTISVRTSHMRTDHDLWEGVQVEGMPKQVYLRGRLLVENNNWLGQPGYGQLLKRDDDFQFV